MTLVCRINVGSCESCDDAALGGSFVAKTFCIAASSSALIIPSPSCHVVSSTAVAKVSFMKVTCQLTECTRPPVRGRGQCVDGGSAAWIKTEYRQLRGSVQPVHNNCAGARRTVSSSSNEMTPSPSLSRPLAWIRSLKTVSCGIAHRGHQVIGLES